MKKAPETFQQWLDRTDRELFYKRFNAKRFGNVIVVAALLGLQSYVHAFANSQRVRHQVFSDEWVMANLEPYHKSNMEQEVEYPYMGYPDSGAGWYARRLPYKDWFAFNCAQRVHMNNVEHLSYTIPLFFASGIFFPRFVAGMGGVVLVGRELYRVGYMTP